MLAPTPPEERRKYQPPRQPIHGVIPVLIVIILLGLLGFGGARVMIKLIKDDRMAYCQAAGQRHCIPLPEQ